jgi:hypothetical protein
MGSPERSRAQRISLAESAAASSNPSDGTARRNSISRASCFALFAPESNSNRLMTVARCSTASNLSTALPSPFPARLSSRVRADPPGLNQKALSFRRIHRSLQRERLLDCTGIVFLFREVKFQRLGHNGREPRLTSTGSQFEESRAMFRLYLNRGSHICFILATGYWLLCRGSSICTSSPGPAFFAVIVP